LRLVTEQKGNRESTIERKIRYLKQLRGSPQDVASQVLATSWKDGKKEKGLDAVEQYEEYLNAPFDRPNFRAYDNQEMYVPYPEMVKQFLYRVRSPRVRARIKVAVETGASAGEVWRLTWKDSTFQTKLYQ
jgi:integrase